MAEPRGSLLEVAPPAGAEAVASPPAGVAADFACLPVKRLRGPAEAAAGGEVITPAPVRFGGLSGTVVTPSGRVRPECRF